MKPSNGPRSLTEEERNTEDGKFGLQDAAEFEQALRKEGIDVDKLIVEYETWKKAVAQRGQQVVQGLSGETVKLAGYLLPLEFSEDGQTEFLLVPYVGACIHAPVPSPSQIVFLL